MFWIYLTATILSDFLGIFFAGKYGKTEENSFLILSFLSFGFLGFFLAQMMKFEKVGIANLITASATIAFGLLIGFTYFQEKVTTLQSIGILVVITGVILIEWK